MNPVIVFDFETDGIDPHTCQPVQLACMTIDPFSLKLIEESSFSSFMRPEGIDDNGYFTDKVKSTIQWHAKNYKCSFDDVVDKWKEAPPQKNVWESFVDHVNKYNPKKTQSGAPIAAGMNIRNFDLPIVDRMKTLYKTKKLFNYEVVDLRDLFFYSLIWDNDLRSRSMDNMRKYFGMPNILSHDALQDVRDEGALVIRYLEFFKKTFNRSPNPYKGCMK